MVSFYSFLVSVFAHLKRQGFLLNAEHFTEAFYVDGFMNSITEFGCW